MKCCTFSSQNRKQNVNHVYLTMKTTLQVIVWLIFTGLLLQACTIQKRVHQPGFHVEWKTSKKSAHEKPVLEPLTAQEESITFPETIATPSLSQTENISAAIESEEKWTIPSFSISPNSNQVDNQDTSIEPKRSEERVQLPNEPDDEPLPKPRKTEKEKNRKMARTSLIMGILALLTFGYLGIIFGPLAIVFGSKALKKIKANPEEYGGSKMARAGLIMGIVVCALLALLILFLLFILVLFLFYY